MCRWGEGGSDVFTLVLTGDTGVICGMTKCGMGCRMFGGVDCFESDGEIIIGINASALARDAKRLGLEEVRGLMGMLSSVGGRNVRIILISSNTMDTKITGVKFNEVPSAPRRGRTVTTIKRDRLVGVCSGFFSSCNRAITRVLVAGRILSGPRHHYTTRGAFHELLRVGYVPIIGRGSSISASRLAGFNNGSVLSTCITRLIGTSILLGLSSISKLCSDSPEDGPSTRLVRHIRTLSRHVCNVTNNTNASENAKNVVTGLGTTGVIARRKVPVFVLGNRRPRVLCALLSNKHVNACFITGGTRGGS